MSKIKIGSTLDGKSIQLDLGVLSETRMFINATSGGGKSSLMRTIAERAAKHTQIIIFDWEGEYSTLREKVDLLIVGNMDGADIPADVRTAKRLALRLLETKVSAVIDLSELEEANRNLYAADFVMAMVNAPRKLWHSVFVFADEYQELAPQSAGGRKSDDPLMQSLNAFKKLGSLGRKRGFCLIAATNRITKVNKDAISTLKNQLTGQTVLDVDMDRAADNLGFNKENKMSLRNLTPGDWYGLGPALNVKGVAQFHADQGETTHLGAGQRNELVIPAPTSAIRNALTQFQDLPAEVQHEENELAELRKENARLKMEAQRRPVQVQTQVEIKTERVEVPVILTEDIGVLEKIAQLDAKQLDEWKSIIEKLDDARATIVNAVPIRQDTLDHLNALIMMAKQPMRQSPQPQPRKLVVATGAELLAGHGIRRDAADDTHLKPGETKVLIAAAQYPDGVTMEQLAVLTNYRKTSRETYTKTLVSRGLITKCDGVFRITDAGTAALPESFEPLPTGIALQEYWLRELNGGEKKIFQAVLSVYPESIYLQSIMESTGYKKTSVDTYLKELKARKLVTRDSGRARASDELFQGGTR
jgi:DNA-binding MarR family transcriptional regulator